VKILYFHMGADAADPVAADLREFGHSVLVAGGPADLDLPWDDFRPDVIVARLESEAAKGLDVLERLVSKRPLVGAPLLVTGGNELALTAARRLFPDASFARLDALATALASIEAGE
jgi:CheY-like chemotaxis protein